MKQKLILCIGSNLGDRQKNLKTARYLIEERIDKIVEESPIIESSPWGYTSENWFLNQILIIQTDKEPKYILRKTQNIEKLLGKKTDENAVYSDRTIDIDILFYDNLIIDDKSLTIPHPKLQYRKFVLEPLNKLEPNFIHPILNETVNELLNKCEDRSETKWFEDTL